MSKQSMITINIVVFILLVASFSVHARAPKFPFSDGYYCEIDVSMNEPIFIIGYPNVVYPLADYGCKITHHIKLDKGYLVDQTCDVTEDNPDAKRTEHWELSGTKSVIYVDGTRLKKCRR